MVLGLHAAPCPWHGVALQSHLNPTKPQASYASLGSRGTSELLQRTVIRAGLIFQAITAPLHNYLLPQHGRGVGNF